MKSMNLNCLLLVLIFLDYSCNTVGDQLWVRNGFHDNLATENSFDNGESEPNRMFYQSFMGEMDSPSPNSRIDDTQDTSDSVVNVTPKTFSDIFINPRLASNSGGMVLVKKKVPSFETSTTPMPTPNSLKKENPSLAVGHNKKLSIKNIPDDDHSILQKLMKSNWPSGSKPTLVVGEDSSISLKSEPGLDLNDYNEDGVEEGSDDHDLWSFDTSQPPEPQITWSFNTKSSSSKPQNQNPNPNHNESGQSISSLNLAKFPKKKNPATVVVSPAEEVVIYKTTPTPTITSQQSWTTARPSLRLTTTSSDRKIVQLGQGQIQSQRNPTSKINLLIYDPRKEKNHKISVMPHGEALQTTKTPSTLAFVTPIPVSTSLLADLENQVILGPTPVPNNKRKKKSNPGKIKEDDFSKGPSLRFLDSDFQDTPDPPSKKIISTKHNFDYKDEYLDEEQFDEPTHKSLSTPKITKTKKDNFDQYHKSSNKGTLLDSFDDDIIYSEHQASTSTNRPVRQNLEVEDGDFQVEILDTDFPIKSITTTFQAPEIPDAEVDVTQNPSNIVEVDDSLRPMQTLVAQIPQDMYNLATDDGRNQIVGIIVNTQEPDTNVSKSSNLENEENFVSPLRVFESSIEIQNISLENSLEKPKSDLEDLGRLVATEDSLEKNMMDVEVIKSEVVNETKGSPSDAGFRANIFSSNLKGIQQEITALDLSTETLPTTFRPVSGFLAPYSQKPSSEKTVINGHSSPTQVVEALVDSANPLEQSFNQKADGMSQSINLKINLVMGDLMEPVKAFISHEQTGKYYLDSEMIRNTTQKPKLTSTKSTTKGPTESNKTSGKLISEPDSIKTNKVKPPNKNKSKSIGNNSNKSESQSKSKKTTSKSETLILKEDKPKVIQKSKSNLVLDDEYDDEQDQIKITLDEDFQKDDYQDSDDDESLTSKLKDIINRYESSQIKSGHSSVASSSFGNPILHTRTPKFYPESKVKAYSSSWTNEPLSNVKPFTFSDFDVGNVKQSRYYSGLEKQNSNYLNWKENAMKNSLKRQGIGRKGTKNMKSQNIMMDIDRRNQDLIRIQNIIRSYDKRRNNRRHEVLVASPDSSTELAVRNMDWTHKYPEAQDQPIPPVVNPIPKFDVSFKDWMEGSVFKKGN